MQGSSLAKEAPPQPPEPPPSSTHLNGVIPQASEPSSSTNNATPTAITNTINVPAINVDVPGLTMHMYHPMPLTPSSATASETASISTRLGKRKQVKVACTNCQKACKRCDVNRPCTRCLKYGIADSCVDSRRKPRRTGHKRGPYKKRDGRGTLYPTSYPISTPMLTLNVQRQIAARATTIPCPRTAFRCLHPLPSTQE